MNDLNVAINRLVGYYNVDHPEFGIKAVASKHIISDDTDNPYQNTSANYITNLLFTGTPTRKVILNPDPDPEPVKLTIIRFEPILTIRTVFTGSDALNNSAKHYERMRNNLSQYTDMSLLASEPFKDASMMFDETRYLIRQQSDARYLVYFDLTVEEEYITSLEAILNCYLDQKFNDLLTSRTIEVSQDE